MASMPKWLIPLIVGAWLGGGIAAYYGFWIPVVVFFGLGILAATSAAGVLWANRKALRMAQNTITSAGPPPASESPAQAAERRRQEARRRQERNRKHRRK